MAGRTAARVITYGFGDDADVRAEAIESLGADGMRFELRTRAGRRQVEIPGLGRHAVHNALAAAAVGVVAGLDLDADRRRPGRPASEAAHRGELIRLGDVTIVDDSYNAAPATMLAALDVLAGLPGRRVAVLGEMLELGRRERGRPSLEVGRAAAASPTCSSWSGTRRAGWPRARSRPGLEPSRILRGRRRRGRPRRPPSRGWDRATSCSSRHRAGSSSTASSTTLREELGP